MKKRKTESGAGNASEIYESCKIKVEDLEEQTEESESAGWYGKLNQDIYEKAENEEEEKKKKKEKKLGKGIVLLHGKEAGRRAGDAKFKEDIMQKRSGDDQSDGAFESVFRDEYKKKNFSNLRNYEKHGFMDARQKMECRRMRERLYIRSNLFKVPLMAMLFFALFESLSGGAALTDWRFLILSAAMLVELVLIKSKWAGPAARCVVAGLSVFSMASLGADASQVIILVAAVFGNEGMVLACIMGGGFWWIDKTVLDMAWTDVFGAWNVGWIVIIALFVVCRSYCQNLYDAGKMSDSEPDLTYVAELKICVIAFIAGIVIFVLARNGALEASSFLVRAHLLRLAAAVFLIRLFVPFLKE